MHDVVSLIPVPVARHTLFVADAEKPLVPLRPICQAIGMAWQVQHRKVASHPTFGPCVTMVATHDSSGRRQDMLCMPTDMVMGWLLTIHPDKVAPKARGTLIAFQRECFRLLHDAWQAVRFGIQPRPGRPSGDLLDRTEGPPPLTDHPTVARAIARCLRAGEREAATFRETRAERSIARREAASIGLTARELRILVEREKWRRAAGHDQPALPLGVGA